ncbi:hypothetical protein [Fluviispira vulneris]|uniref:hypothetical protein n=1 Tax=Fluviispira vulneris TaxID=2763012 RepID=UPI00164462D1|nr:hypothetical protein [Fluviispira vulneris]
MLFILNASKEKWFKKYRSFTCTPEMCPACKITAWEDAVFQYWITKDHVGFFRTCEKCSKFQTVLTPRNIKEQQKLNRLVFNLTCEYREI